MVTTPRKVAAFLVTAAALVALFFVAVNTGSLQVGPMQLLGGLFVSYDETVSTIYDLRLPRILIAMVGGAATAVAGVLLQAAIRNPLADPGIICLSAGASFDAVLVTAFFPMLLFFTAFDSGTGSTMSGVASLVDANITMKTWDDFATLAVYAAVGLVLALLMAKRCDLLALEDKTARSLGLNVDRARIATSAAGVLLASVSTAIIGPISFLGLLVPHIARILVGTSHRALIPYAIVLGAFALLLADTIGRTVAAPYEISAAVIMSIAGGPLFIVLLRRAGSGYGE